MTWGEAFTGDIPAFEKTDKDSEKKRMYWASG